MGAMLGDIVQVADAVRTARLTSQYSDIDRFIRWKDGIESVKSRDLR